MVKLYKLASLKICRTVTSKTTYTQGDELGRVCNAQSYELNIMYQQKMYIVQAWFSNFQIICIQKMLCSVLRPQKDFVYMKRFLMLTWIWMSSDFKQSYIGLQQTNEYILFSLQEIQLWKQHEKEQRRVETVVSTAIVSVTNSCACPVICVRTCRLMMP